MLRLFSKIEASYKQLPTLQSAKAIYPIMDAIASETKRVYPSIMCGAGCSFCCYGSSGLPVTTAEEWRLIEERLVQERSYFQKVKKKASDLYTTYKAIWESLTPLLSPPFTQETLTQRAKLLSQIPFTISCVFLEGGECGIYEVRPGACRAYGFFAIEMNQTTTLHSCDMEYARFFGGQEERQLILPIWNRFFERFQSLSKGDPVALLLERIAQMG